MFISILIKNNKYTECGVEIKTYARVETFGELRNNRMTSVICHMFAGCTFTVRAGHANTGSVYVSALRSGSSFFFLHLCGGFAKQVTPTRSL